MVATLLFVVRSESLLHPFIWFTHIPCYVVGEGSLSFYVTSKSNGSLYVCATSTSKAHSPILLHPTDGSLSYNATSISLVHSLSGLHLGAWFTLAKGYIFKVGSLQGRATSICVIHSHSVLHLIVWFTLAKGYIVPIGSLLVSAISGFVVHLWALLHQSK